jgi:hypothetical protein
VIAVGACHPHDPEIVKNVGRRAVTQGRLVIPPHDRPHIPLEIAKNSIDCVDVAQSKRRFCGQIRDGINIPPDRAHPEFERLADGGPAAQKRIEDGQMRKAAPGIERRDHVRAVR